jgi:membrane protein required for colicin V production
MTWFDLAVLGIIGVSVLLGVLRGLVREVFSIAGWLLAFFLARRFAESVAVLFPVALQPAELRLAVAFSLVVVLTVLVCWMGALLVGEVMKATGLRPMDRTLGAVFGLARGALVVVVGVLVAGLTAVPASPGWRNAWLSPPFEQLALSARAWLPDTVKSNIRYDRP